MARQTLRIGTPYSFVRTAFSAAGQLSWNDLPQPGGRPTILPLAIASDLGTGRIDFIRMSVPFSGLPNPPKTFEVSVHFETGGRMSIALEHHGSALRIRSPGTSFDYTFPGPRADGNDSSGRAPQYSWEFTDSDAYDNFLDDFQSLSLAQIQNIELIFDDGASQPRGVAPAFSDDTGDRITGETGTAISPVTVPSAGGTPAGTYAVVGSLPSGLSFDPSTRRLSGTPRFAGSGTITIRASNATGHDDWTVDYAFTSPAPTTVAPTFSDPTGDAISGVRGTAIAAVTVPAAAGTSPTYEVVGSLPSGLSFDRNTRRISGTPTSAGSGTIRIRARNSAGTADWTVTYFFTDPAPPPPGTVRPSFSNPTGSAISGTVGTAIANVTVPAAAGTPAPTYAVMGSLPVGLSFNPNTRVLSGTPTAAGAGTIRIRATNSAGTADWTVAYSFAGAGPGPGPAPTTGSGDLYLSGTTTDRIYRRAGGYTGASWDGGIAIPSLTQPNLSGIALDSAGDLYAVVAFTISGTRTRAGRIYRRAGGYGGASWDAGISLPSAVTAPTGITFDADGNLYVVGQVSDRIYRRAGGYGGASWDAGISLPSGVSGPTGIAFDADGNLYVVDWSGDRTYRRAGGYGGASWDAGIAPPSGATNPRGIAFDSAGDLYLVDLQTDRVYRRAGGYTGASWDAGIAVPAAERAPTDIAFPSAVAPSFADATGDPISGTAGTAIANVTVPAASGAPAPTYAVVGSLPIGLSFNPSTRVLSGTPDRAGSGTIRIRATNSAGTADWTVTYAFVTPGPETATPSGLATNTGTLTATATRTSPPPVLATPGPFASGTGTISAVEADTTAVPRAARATPDDLAPSDTGTLTAAATVTDAPSPVVATPEALTSATGTLAASATIESAPDPLTATPGDLAASTTGTLAASATITAVPDPVTATPEGLTSATGTITASATVTQVTQVVATPEDLTATDTGTIGTVAVSILPVPGPVTATPDGLRTATGTLTARASVVSPDPVTATVGALASTTGTITASASLTAAPSPVAVTPGPFTQTSTGTLAASATLTLPIDPAVAEVPMFTTTTGDLGTVRATVVFDIPDFDLSRAHLAGVATIAGSGGYAVLVQDVIESRRPNIIPSTGHTTVMRIQCAQATEGSVLVWRVGDAEWEEIPAVLPSPGTLTVPAISESGFGDDCYDFWMNIPSIGSISLTLSLAARTGDSRENYQYHGQRDFTIGSVPAPIQTYTTDQPPDPGPFPDQTIFVKVAE